MNRPKIRAQLTILAVLAATGALGTAATVRAQEDGHFPHTRKRGQAAVEYRDDQVHAVVAYYYSQRNHDSRWVLVEAAVSTTDNTTFDRENIRIVTPSGRETTLATQAEVLGARDTLTQLVQNASTTRHGVLTYFSERGTPENMRLFSLTSGAVLTNFVTDRNHVAHGDLFFQAPNGVWEPGTYSLVFERDGLRAVLPITLD
jgi:hypothetical protein